MSNSIKRIYEEWEDYVNLCSILGRTTLPVRGGGDFYEDEKKILAEYGCENREELFDLINCVKREYEDS